jgi:excisionase family DNA binding protein
VAGKWVQKGYSEEEIAAMANAVHQMLREVMDIRQASEYLGISGDTLYRYASEGFIPAFKLGNRWRFKRSLLDAWMVEKSGSRTAYEDAGVAVMPKQKKPVRRVR